MCAKYKEGLRQLTHSLQLGAVLVTPEVSCQITPFSEVAVVSENQ